ncbi:Rieske (2Fe-2S) domain-containing protein [Salinisphaera hydrothermalis C27AD]
MDNEFAAYGFEEYTYYRRESWEGAFNWKSGVEQFLENYHFAVLHRDSTNWLFIHNLALCDRFERHFRGVAPKRSIRDLANQPREHWSLRPNATIIYTIFPVATFFVEKSHFSLLQIFPIGPERSRIEITHVAGQDQLSKRPFWEANIDLFKAAVNEDLETCETMQAGFRSRANDYLMFGRNEIGLDQYRRCIEDALDTEIQQA